MDDYQIVCDNVVFAQDGIRLNEAMFSGVFNLLANSEEIALRIHPVKKKLFDAILTGKVSSTTVIDKQTNSPVEMPLNKKITIHINGPDGTYAVSYADIAQLFPLKSLSREFQMEGFDKNAEPVIRLMKDASLRLLFCTMPPKRNPLGTAFDMDVFGTQLQQNVSAKIVWDDRDVFYIKSSEPNNVREIANFLYEYGK